MITEIPLSSSPNQTYTVMIPGENRNITFIINQNYNGVAGYWEATISNQYGNPIVSNIPMLCGEDLLEQFQYLDIGSLYIVNIGDQTVDLPNDKNIADNFEMVWCLE